MNLDELRQRIDGIDDDLVRLFVQRMEASAQIAEYKRENKLPVLDTDRERQKLAAVAELAGEELRSYACTLYSLLFELSRAYQTQLLSAEDDNLSARIKQALDTTEQIFPDFALVACSGVEGSYSQIATDRLFAHPNIMHFNSFDAVFSALKAGLCRYGVLPLENSTAGSVNLVYDLMMRYDFKIVRSVRLKIDHSLLARPGTKKEDIREIFSHEQALDQCAGYLNALGKDVKVTVCATTSDAAQLVAESERSDVAALASHSCCELYGLECLEASVQDKGNNYTRFICISKDLEIYPGANRTSIMLTTSHKPGALYKVLERFFALGINIVKLESRPLPDRDFEFMFYFDLEAPVYAPELLQLMRELEGLCEEFRYLGSYAELV